MRDLDHSEIEKLAQLRRVKFFATGMLALCFCLMVVAKVLEHSFPGMALVVAFTEAATIGGIADWYAVVALFKHPMGLPLPHTAIIPANQHRIGDNLGRFIERNFLADGPIQARLQEIDFAGEIAKWLSDPVKSASLATFITRFIPQLLDAVDQKGIVGFATESVTRQLKGTDISPLVGDVIDALATERTHNRLMDDVITALHGFLEDEDTLEMIRLRVNNELPTLLKFIPADKMIMQRIVKALVELTTEIKDDRDHPLRKELEAFLIDYVRRLKSSKNFAARVDQMKHALLNRPEINDMADQIWRSLSGYVRKDVGQEDSLLARRLGEIFVDVGIRLEQEHDLRRDINTGMVTVLRGMVAENRSEIATFVSDQVKSWDFEQLALLIEANVGKDLQYIRFNGMLIGGFVGLLLFLAESLIR